MIIYYFPLHAAKNSTFKKFSLKSWYLFQEFHRVRTNRTRRTERGLSFLSLTFYYIGFWELLFSGNSVQNRMAPKPPQEPLRFQKWQKIRKSFILHFTIKKARGLLPLSTDGGVPLRFEKWTPLGTQFCEKVTLNGTEIPISTFFSKFLKKDTLPGTNFSNLLFLWPYLGLMEVKKGTLTSGTSPLLILPKYPGIKGVTKSRGLL